LAHVEDENLLSQVFSRPYETRTKRLARLTATFRPMHDNEGFILQRKPGWQEAQRLRIIDFDGPGRIEVYLPAGIRNGLEREGRSESVVLPLLVSIDANVEKAFVGRLEAWIERLADPRMVLSVLASTPNETRCWSADPSKRP